MTIPPCPHCAGRVMLDTVDDEWLCLHCARRWPRIPREPLPYVIERRGDRAGKSQPK